MKLMAQGLSGAGSLCFCTGVMQGVPNIHSLEVLHLIAAINSTASERIVHELTCCRFINMRIVQNIDWCDNALSVYIKDVIKMYTNFHPIPLRFTGLTNVLFEILAPSPIR